MDPELQEYLDALQTGMSRLPISNEEISDRVEQAGQEIELQRIAIVNRGISENVTRKAIDWHREERREAFLAGQRPARA